MDFRGATVEDLHLPPIRLLCADDSIAEASDLMADSFPPLTMLPVLDSRSSPRRVVGMLYLADVEAATLPAARVRDLCKALSPAEVRLSTAVEQLVQALQSAVLAEVWDDSRTYLLATATLRDVHRRFPQEFKASSAASSAEGSAKAV